MLNSLSRLVFFLLRPLFPSDEKEKTFLSLYFHQQQPNQAGQRPPRRRDRPHGAGQVSQDSSREREREREREAERKKSVIFLLTRTKETKTTNPGEKKKHSPSISDAVAKAASLGASRVVLAPYFLSRGRHVREDIPSLSREAERATGLPVTVAEPFGVDETLAAAIEVRVARAAERKA